MLILALTFIYESKTYCSKFSMKISAADITINSPVPLASNIAENEFSATLTKFKLQKEPKNSTNTKTRAKECKVWASNSIKVYLHNT